MPDRLFTPDETQGAFREASHWWRSLVGGIDDHQWDQPGIGLWSVRELVAHGARAYKTIVEYAEGPVKDPTPITSAAQYFRIVLAEETPHVHIAERARREAPSETDWVSATDGWASAVDARLADLDPEHVLHLFVGEMPLSQYLATRVVELVLHGLDLSAAIGLPVPAPPAAGRLALEVLLDLGSPDHLSAALRLVSGRPTRTALPNVLA